MIIPPATPSRPAIEPWRWQIVWLLFLATMINYMDRLALANTSDYILKEFEADPAKRNALYGDINFAFGISFGLFQVVAGFLADRFSLRWLYLGAIVVWSGAGFLTGFVPAGAVAMLMVCRVVLGIGEAFNWPCAVATVRRVVPRESRGLANGIFHSGASIGAVGTPLLVLLLVGPGGEGWRTVFILVGGVGALWGVLWIYATRGERGHIINTAPPLDPDVVRTGNDRPFIELLRGRFFWICLATGCCVNMCWHFYNTWFVRYLSDGKGMNVDPATKQWILAGFFVAADLGSMVSGWLTRRLIRSGMSVERARKQVMFVLALVCLVSIPAASIGGQGISIALFFVVAAGAMGGFAIFFSLAQDIVPRHTAQILGVCGATSWMFIAATNKFVGQVANADTFPTLFMVIGSIPMIAALAGRFWPEPTSTRTGKRVTVAKRSSRKKRKRR